jgi:hypothetical protein
MDDNDHDKSIIEKTIEAVKTIASDAAKKALETEPLRPGEQVMMLPLMDSGLATEPMMPPFVVLPRRKSRAKTALTAKKAAKKPAAKKSSRKRKLPRRLQRRRPQRRSQNVSHWISTWQHQKMNLMPIILDRRQTTSQIRF